MDARTLARLERSARFQLHAPAFHEGVEYEVVRRFFRRSVNTVMYDLRDYRNGRVLMDIPDGALRTPMQEHDATRVARRLGR